MNPKPKSGEIENKDDRDDHQADEGMSDEEKDASEIAKRRVRLGLLLSEIGRKNNIKVEEEEQEML